MLHKQVRELFPALQTTSEFKINNPLPNRTITDNAASSQMSQPVIQAMLNAMPVYANIDRGEYEAAKLSDRICKSALNIAANFINAPTYSNMVLTGNTTGGLNLVQLGMMDQMADGDNIVITALEHSSNAGPWIGMRDLLAARPKPVSIQVKIAGIDLNTGQVDYDDLAKKVDGRTRLVSCTAASNFFGVKPDISRVADIAKNNGAMFMVDGAQFTPSNFVDVQAMGCDFYAFPGHKMGVPLGIGMLYGATDAMDSISHVFHGGGMYEYLQPSGEQWREHPWDFIPGTPNILGSAALGEGVAFLVNTGLGHRYLEEGLTDEERIERVGRLITVKRLLMTKRGAFPYSFEVPAEYMSDWVCYQKRHPEMEASYGSAEERLKAARNYVECAMDQVRDHLRELTQITLEALANISGVTVYGPMDAMLRTPLVSFNVDGMDSSEVGRRMAEQGVENRANHHCAYFAHQALGIPGSVRISYWVQNNKDDVDKVIDTVERIVRG